MQDETQKKLSHKGFSKKIDVNDHDYLRCLYENDPGSVTYGQISISKKECRATTRALTKRALNGLYMKFYVEENRVTIRPHKLNENYV